MGTLQLFYLCLIAAHVTSHQIKIRCCKFDDLPSFSDTYPSELVGLEVEHVRINGDNKLNISWAINIDASTKYMTGTLIGINYETNLCEYNPPLANANLTGLEKEWFHLVVNANPGFKEIYAHNVPQTGAGIPSAFKSTTITIPEKVAPKSTQATPGSMSPPEPTSPETIPPWISLTVKDITVLSIGILAALMILSSCCVMYKFWWLSRTSPLALGNWSTDTMAPVPVLLVYPAVNSTFQGAVLALAEFLQFNCSCTVTTDIWQQGKIAELGPMRWLAEQTKAVERVLIVSPQPENSSSQLNYPLIHNLPEPSIPAAAHDLYPLILNMVASHGKDARELAKFWVVQLSEKNNRHSMPLELRTCKTFCLMKDLNKLCKCLHTQRHSKKMSDVIRPGDIYASKSTVKLRNAIEKLKGGKPDFSKKMEPHKIMYVTV